MEKIATNLDKYFNMPNPGLRAYLQHNVVGNQDDYRPPFWKGQSRSSVLKAWEKVLLSSGMKTAYPDLYRYELDMAKKVGPMSIQAPLSERIDSIKSYYTSVESPGEPVDSYAIQLAGEYFRPARGIRMRSQQNVVEKMRLNTNSGAPYFSKRRSVVGKTIPATISQGKQYLGKTGAEYELAAVLGWRGQEGGPNPSDVKQRVVWMMPFGLNVAELQVYQPAIEAFQTKGLIPAFNSMEAVDQAVTKLFASKDDDEVVVCTDFTAFDQHFNVNLQNTALEMLRMLMTPDAATETWYRTVFPLKYNLPLVCSEEISFTGPHGMGSGSGGTNFDECLAHKALQYEAAMASHATLNEHSMAYGDDGILTFPSITAEKVIRSYTRHGLEMNPDKQYVSTHDCVFLRRWHGTDYTVQGSMVGVYSTCRALGRLLAQERYYDPDTWSASMVELRAWSIIENCHYSPVFEEFVDFVIKGDKYRLGLGIPGFLENIGDISKEAKDKIPDFLGYTKTLQGEDVSGIENWRIYKYLKSKA